MLAVEAMSGTVQFLIYLVGFILFVAAGVIAASDAKSMKPALVPFGLAAFILVPMWNALAAA